MSKYQILKDFDKAYVHVCDLLGDKSTNNLQLLNFGAFLFGDKFKSVYCADDNIRLHNDQCCIVNTDPHTKSGTHWLGLYKYRNVYYVFDSFGRDVRKLSKFFKKKTWQNFEFHRIESFRSENCGVLSLTFLIIFDKYKLKCRGVI